MCLRILSLRLRRLRTGAQCSMRTNCRSTPPTRVGRTPVHRLRQFERLEERLPLTASPIDGVPYVDLGPSDNVAWDQPRVTVQFITEDLESVGPGIFNTWLLDTGANSILGFQTAINDMNEAPPLYETEGKFEEFGVGGTQLFDISKDYRFDFAGHTGVRNTLNGTRIISDATRDVSIFGPWGIVGMPAMTERITTYDFTPWTTIEGLELFMKTDFADEVPAYDGPRLSISVDNRVAFEPEGQIIEGDHPPAWADIPFMDATLMNNDNLASGNFLFDSGAQVSIFSSEMAFELGLDTNQDGELNQLDAHFARMETIGGVGGFLDVPVFLIDEVHIPTDQGPDIVLTDLQWMVLDIYPGIDAVFGFDNMTSGWIEASGENGKSGYIMQTHVDFRGWESTGQGTIWLDINPEIYAVVDPNGPGATVVESGGSTVVSESGVNDSYEIWLNTQPTSNVTISLHGGGNEVIAWDSENPGNAFLTFTPGNWNVPQTVVVEAVDDNEVEDFQRSYVRHQSTSLDPAYEGVGMPRVVVGVIDNDLPSVMIIPTDGATIVDEDGGSDTYYLVLTFPTTEDVSIELEHLANQVTAVSGIDGTSRLTFTSENWDVPQPVVVTAVDDDLVEGPHRAFITHRISTSDEGYQSAFVLQEMVSILDNDGYDELPPVVTDVIVASSSWDEEFIDMIDGGGSGAGNGLGLSLPGAEQLTNVTWDDIDRIYIEFSGNVGEAFTLDNLSLIGTNVADYLVGASLDFGVAGDYIGTISLPVPIENDALILTIFDSLTDSAGNQLDGEWINESSLHSGDGIAGGQFDFRIDVLPGDVNNSDGVNVIDYILTYQKGGQLVSDIVDARFDLNNNNGINIVDAILVYFLGGKALPEPPSPPSPPTGMFQSGDSGNDGGGVRLGGNSPAANVWLADYDFDQFPLQHLLHAAPALRHANPLASDQVFSQWDPVMPSTRLGDNHQTAKYNGEGGIASRTPGERSMMVAAPPFTAIGREPRGTWTQPYSASTRISLAQEPASFPSTHGTFASHSMVEQRNRLSSGVGYPTQPTDKGRLPRLAKTLDGTSINGAGDFLRPPGTLSEEPYHSSSEFTDS
jgi:hypothetical protein